MIAKELMTAHNLKQAEAAELLGVSQPAISLYYRKMRGKAIDLDNEVEVKRLIEKLTTSLVEGNLPRKDFTLKFCEICKTIRAKGLLCQMHKAFDPSIDVEKCEICSTITNSKCI
jgi:predicted transcriptional regulator